jgi:hypothetical protein
VGGDSLTKQYSFIDEDDYEIKGDTSWCVKCEKDLPASFFSRNSGRPYLRTECNKCLTHMRKVIEHLKKTNSYPPEDYNCPICLRKGEDVLGLGGKTHKSPWVLDHCHETNEFRGWLCHSCNRTLGGFKDDIDRLLRAIDYLEQLK